MKTVIPFAKGHATENDFIIISDEQAKFDLSPETVAALCDRRAGIGADGILRVVKSSEIADSTVDPDLWFMDYRNADGSLAEMCGNGVRLFAHWLRSRGLVAVSYTHLDVYKRQAPRTTLCLSTIAAPAWRDVGSARPSRILKFAFPKA